MSIKVIVSDLDRTLLRSDKTVSDYTRDVLHRAREQGIKFVPATARATTSFESFGFECDAAITFNGGVLLVGGETVNFTMPAATAHEVVRMVLELVPTAEIGVETVNGCRANFDIARIWPQIVWTADDFAARLPADAFKVLIPLEGFPMLDELERRLPGGVHIEVSEGVLAMVQSDAATKLCAFRHLCGLWGIDLADAVMFGDDLNDVELLRTAGIGVAVANALDVAKDAADEICDENDADGVAKWIEHNILNTLGR